MHMHNYECSGEPGAVAKCWWCCIHEHTQQWATSLSCVWRTQKLVVAVIARLTVLEALEELAGLALEELAVLPLVARYALASYFARLNLHYLAEGQVQLR